jgi:hypothetical protein
MCQTGAHICRLVAHILQERKRVSTALLPFRSGRICQVCVGHPIPKRDRRRTGLKKVIVVFDGLVDKSLFVQKGYALRAKQAERGIAFILLPEGLPRVESLFAIGAESPSSSASGLAPPIRPLSNRSQAGGWRRERRLAYGGGRDAMEVSLRVRM